MNPVGKKPFKTWFFDIDSLGLGSRKLAGTASSPTAKIDGPN